VTSSSDHAQEERLSERLDALFASDPRAMASPVAIFRAAGDAARFYEHGPMVILTRYEDVKAALRVFPA
jgi:hypothetical protein